MFDFPVTQEAAGVDVSGNHMMTWLHIALKGIIYAPMMLREFV